MLSPVFWTVKNWDILSGDDDDDNDNDDNDNDDSDDSNDNRKNKNLHLKLYLSTQKVPNIEQISFGPAQIRIIFSWNTNTYIRLV